MTSSTLYTLQEISNRCLHFDFFKWHFLAKFGSKPTSGCKFVILVQFSQTIDYQGVPKFRLFASVKNGQKRGTKPALFACKSIGFTL